jgi:hypothetical protein
MDFVFQLNGVHTRLGIFPIEVLGFTTKLFQIATGTNGSDMSK